MKSLVRRLALVSAMAVLGSCLWRPPVIPPLATSDAGMSTRDASTGGIDSSMPPAEDASTVLTDEQACDVAARANDGSVPSSVFNGGRLVNCGDSAQADASPSDAGSVDSAADAGDGPTDGADVTDASGDGPAASARDDASVSDAEDSG